MYMYVLNFISVFVVSLYFCPYVLIMYMIFWTCCIIMGLTLRTVLQPAPCWGFLWPCLNSPALSFTVFMPYFNSEYKTVHIYGDFMKIRHTQKTLKLEFFSVNLTSVSKFSQKLFAMNLKKWCLVLAQNDATCFQVPGQHSFALKS